MITYLFIHQFAGTLAHHRCNESRKKGTTLRHIHGEKQLRSASVRHCTRGGIRVVKENGGYDSKDDDVGWNETGLVF